MKDLYVRFLFWLGNVFFNLADRCFAKAWKLYGHEEWWDYEDPQH